MPGSLLTQPLHRFFADTDVAHQYWQQHQVGQHYDRDAHAGGYTQVLDDLDRDQHHSDKADGIGNQGRHPGDVKGAEGASVAPDSTTAGIMVGKMQETGTEFDGLIAEVVILDGAVNEDTRQKMVGYLAWKWGMEARLPADHPYKSAPPAGAAAPGTLISGS